MQLPSLRPERARNLYISGITTITQITQKTPKDLVAIFAKQEGFQSHSTRNQEDLKLRYEYLYSLANSICLEAGVWSSKQTIQDEEFKTKFREGKKVITDYVIDSDDEEVIEHEQLLLDDLNESEL